MSNQLVLTLLYHFIHLLIAIENLGFVSVVSLLHSFVYDAVNVKIPTALFVEYHWSFAQST